MSSDIFLIISPFINPVVGYRQLQSGIGIGQNRDPFIGMNRRPIIQVRTNIDLLDAQLGKPVADQAGIKPPPNPQGVVSGSQLPENNHFGILSDIRVDV